MATLANKEDVEKLFRMVGWQIAAGILFLAFGMDLSFSNAILHALQPFEHVRHGFEAFLGLEGVIANGLLIVGALNLGVAGWRFARVLRYISDRLTD